VHFENRKDRLILIMKKILIVDDEYSLLRLSQIIFQRKGYDVAVALSASEAKKKLLAATDFDAIILDLMMPDENGFDFLKWMEAQPDDSGLKKIPVIVNTAKNLNDDELAFLNGHARKIMQKGINFADRLVSEVESIF